MAAYNESEFLICLASKLMADGTTAFVGTGIPMLASALAKRMHAPNLVPIFEFGGTGASLEKLPLGVGDSRTFHKAVAASGSATSWRPPPAGSSNTASSAALRSTPTAT